MSWIKVLSQDELAQGDRKVVATEGGPVLVVNYNGDFYAVGSKCPHMKLPLRRGKLTDDGALVCPFHRSAFDLKTGEPKTWTPFPPVVGSLLGKISTEKPLPTYPTKVEEGSIWVEV
ncbi:Rieske (2Fe-2S) protein [Synechococcus sp. PCC 7336]|uniref:Rieske (2Fe-2S) protein n=1 Tax=Synechococcus sp. PCC 7336 TaxID=195250 RepID=UPI0003498CD6|nr:Rieske (2Fe-2S) protein [Synechococcus sp. PCC 7336]